MTINLDEIEKALGEITQGGWFVDHEHPMYCINLKGEDALRHIAMVSCFDYYYGAAEENIANARLIAHAPEWLRMLVERVRMLETVAEAASGVASSVLVAKEHSKHRQMAEYISCMNEATGPEMDTLIESLVAANVTGWEK